mmetsp:Transcript_47032/g.122405  ORF Transcript_47032/g.122405 Transcript_47032/m.122405 type:complete len:200 (-) Transcript_47032:2663-3262(-)
MLLHCSCRNGTGTSCWCRSSEHARGCCSCNCRPQQQTVRTQSATKKSGSTQQATSWHPCGTKRRNHRWSGHACRCLRHLHYGNASVREERLQHLNTIFFGDSGRAPCGCCTEWRLSEVIVMMMMTCHAWNVGSVQSSLVSCFNACCSSIKRRFIRRPSVIGHVVGSTCLLQEGTWVHHGMGVTSSDCLRRSHNCRSPGG